MGSSHVEESKLTMTRRKVNGAVAALLLLPALASAADVVLPPPDKQMSWTPEQKIVGFRNIARIYGGDVVHHGTKVLPLPRSARELEVQYLDAAGHSVTITKFMEDNRVVGLIVLARGKIVLERYAPGQTEHDQWVSFSVAKSVTSTLLGAAIRDGAIRGLDDLVSRYIPELAESGYQGVTLRQALIMATGLRWKEVYEDPPYPEIIEHSIRVSSRGE
jgi:CubicO group peptidase (beta-lactamase class C family)